MERWSSMQELPSEFPNSPAVHTVKDQEWLIQDLKKENFDLKLRLFMEQKEREKLQNGTNRQTGDLEADLTEALDELEHAMDKENQLTNELNSGRRREKALATKLKRLERVCQQQEEDIIRMSVEIENLKMEMAAKDSGIVSPHTNTRSGNRLQYSRRTEGSIGGRMSPTSDITYSDRMSGGYPERFWDHYSDRGSDSGSYATTPKDRNQAFFERYADDISTSDESEVRQRGTPAGHPQSDTERVKRREKLLSRRLKNYQEVEDHKGTPESEGNYEEQPEDTCDGAATADNTPTTGTPGYHNERGVDVTPDLLAPSPQSRKFLSRPRWFGGKKHSKGNSSKAKSKSMDALDTITRVDVKNIHKKNKKYNFWGCVRARESINENIRSEYAPVKRPQLTQTADANGTTKPVENNNSNDSRNNSHNSTSNSRNNSSNSAKERNNSETAEKTPAAVEFI